ncbi:hypothetical protein [Clostridium sporogenes]|uniref:hypothetical protein n=1 Tax=Clostridium sporogenes TaxID=1509 RepID=UPI001FAC2D80|nr:hypothetical protein [Clostridium sporogenes]
MKGTSSCVFITNSLSFISISFSTALKVDDNVVALAIKTASFPFGSILSFTL